MCLEERLPPPAARVTPRGILALGALALIALAVGAGCSTSGPTGPTPVTNCPAGEWATDSGGNRTWGHDCSPFRGPHFTVYSDGSSAESRAALAAMAEGFFAEVAAILENPSDAELGISADHTLYAFAEWAVTPMVFEGYPNGFLAPALDRPGPYQSNPTWYRLAVKHEVTHTISLGLARCAGRRAPYWPDVWFREGMAVYVSGSQPLPGLAEFRRFVADPTRENPVSFHQWRDAASNYYGWFGLLYAYLLDSRSGYGATVTDVRNLLREMADGATFAAAFEHAFRISLADLEAAYYERMEAFLEAS